jgi:hypothetical protein
MRGGLTAEEYRWRLIKKGSLLSLLPVSRCSLGGTSRNKKARPKPYSVLRRFDMPRGCGPVPEEAPAEASARKAKVS